ncbi:mandelate racemase/muconate lactonizing enzyme family protein [Alicyclobacillus dauci]|uniref:Mandelate racemase n=1 Tax=Alicyclobacillus dauci TaxID=1475485 RepID=A0ABY6YY85_9BACL|nr:enolase C-terminal domain-like protein [Alicyclobacillus dauci]WAH35584.1 mandelate racemase [Alicyclobacillus dauci]
MRIVSVDIFPMSLPMRQSFQIAAGSVGDRATGAPHVYVRVVTEEGFTGWGEARPSHRWSYETIETVVSTIRNYLAPAILGCRIDNLEGVHQAMDGVIANGPQIGQPIAKSAIDMAIHDAAARACHRPLSFLWSRPKPIDAALSYLISSRDPREVEAKAQAAISQGFTGIDVKIGFGLETDLAILEAIETVGQQVFLRVDANQGYQLSDARVVGNYLARIGANVFEQPLKAHDLHGHATLRSVIDVPIALDESILSPRDVMTAARVEACDAIVVKVTKMGGLGRAKLSGEIAHELGLDLLGGGLTESTLGLSAGALLFDAIGITHPVDLNGPFFLQDDPVVNKGNLEGGVIQLPIGDGLGCDISLTKLEEFTVST